MKHSHTKKSAPDTSDKSNTKAQFYDRRKLLLELIPAFFLIATFVIALYAYPLLPQKIPTHWNSAGQADNYSGRASIFFIPMVFLVCMILFFILPLMEVFRENMLKIYNYYFAFKVFFAAFFTVLFVSTLLPNFGYDINVAVITIAMISIMFIGMGLTLPRLKRNYMFGIRTGWTLSNDEVWGKTHKLGGILFTLHGIITLILLFTVSLTTLFMIFMILTIGISLFLVFYSYYIYRKLGRKDL